MSLRGTQLIQPNLVHSLRISGNENVRDAELRRRLTGNLMKVYTMLTTNQSFKNFQTWRMYLFWPFKDRRASRRSEFVARTT